MLSGKVKDATPIKVSVCPVNDVDNVGSIKPLTPGHKQLGDEQLLRRQHACWHAENRCRLRLANPRRVHMNHCIAHAGNEVHEKVVPMYFCKPHRIADLTSESKLLQVSEGSAPVLRGQEKIQVFGGAAYPGVLQQGKGTGDRVRNTP